MDFFVHMLQDIRLFEIKDVIDVLIVSLCVFWVMKSLRNSRIEKLLKGFLLLLLLMLVSSAMELYVVNFLLKNVFDVGIIAVVVLFQPEFRKLLERFGATRLLMFSQREGDQDAIGNSIRETIEAVTELSREKTGALIVFEKIDKLDNIISTGTTVDAKVSSQLLRNIFYEKAPLHDGAVIITEGRIHSAGCILPLSTNFNLSKDLGTRHRAAVGMSESYDSLSVTVSEETGTISLAFGGILKRHLAPETLERLLMKELLPEPEEKKSFFSRLRGKSK